MQYENELDEREALAIVRFRELIERTSQGQTLSDVDYTDFLCFCRNAYWMWRSNFNDRLTPDHNQVQPQKLHRDLLQALYDRGIICVHDGREWRITEIIGPRTDSEARYRQEPTNAATEPQ